MTDAPNLYQKARTDVASMLGYNLDDLAPGEALRVDVASALRVLLDTQSARLVSGQSLDARELLMASEALSRLLPAVREPAAGPREDPRETMWRIYKQMRERGELNLKPQPPDEGRIAELEAEVEQLKARLGIAPALLDVPTNTEHARLLPTSDITPPSEIGHAIVGKVAGPDDPKRPGPVIDGKAVPPAAGAAPRQPTSWDDTDSGRRWRAWVDSGGPGYDRWANRNE